MACSACFALATRLYSYILDGQAIVGLEAKLYVVIQHLRKTSDTKQNKLDTNGAAPEGT